MEGNQNWMFIGSFALTCTVNSDKAKQYNNNIVVDFPISTSPLKYLALKRNN